tara:strand:+ start:2376 stop:2729 length:354 start_codon:yes stop_codon:yes gene_type:complete
MPTESNPYAPPPAPKLVPLLWDRAVLAQLAVAIHVFALVASGGVNSHLASSTSGMIDVTVSFNYTIAVFSPIGFLIVLASTITKCDWPIRFRLWFVGIDALLVALIAVTAHGFCTMP